MDPFIVIVMVLALAGLLAGGAAILSANRARAGAEGNAAALGEALTALADAQQQTSERLMSQQDRLAGQLQQSQITVNERLDGFGKRLGDSLSQQVEKTDQRLKGLQERLAVIDQAQRNITDLSQQMVGLQDILSNKQARGAFGEIQLNDLVTAALPPDAYAFQEVLSNGRRADCLLKLPNPPGAIVIDAKFPLESYQALRAAENDAERVQASRRFSTDVAAHVKAIAERYIVAGETAESALMFLPSEAVYAELHAGFRNVVEESFKRRVWIVSPTTLMATLNTVRAVLKDARMREAAHVIQAEVLKMMEDVGRLDDRVDKLRNHFRQAEKDIGDIEISSGKIRKRGEKIETLQLSDETPAEDLPGAEETDNPRLRAV